ncbi:MAG: ribbon-helix-helix protein, CopG family [Chloroflexi bacterium]|nr:ribbon-helix-helix protein, CopG family [Chloroflexota bacterium]
MRPIKLVDHRGQPRFKYSVVLEPEVAARVREVTIKERRSFSAVVRRALERFLGQVTGNGSSVRPAVALPDAGEMGRRPIALAVSRTSCQLVPPTPLGSYPSRNG